MSDDLTPYLIAAVLAVLALVVWRRTRSTDMAHGLELYDATGERILSHDDLAYRLVHKMEVGATEDGTVDLSGKGFTDAVAFAVSISTDQSTFLRQFGHQAWMDGTTLYYQKNLISGAQTPSAIYVFGRK